jgi:hypothetical protein
MLCRGVQLRNSHDTNSSLGGFSEFDFVVLICKLNQDLSDYAGPDVELVISPVINAGAHATQLTCLQLPTPDALTRSGDFGGHLQRGVSRILCARAYVDLLALCRPTPPDYMRAILGTGRGALALFFALRNSSFKVPSACYTMAAHRVLGLTAERAFHVRKCPRCNAAPSESRGSKSSSTVSGTSRSGKCSTFAMLMGHIPRCPCSWYVIRLHDRIVHVLEEFVLEAGATKGRDLRLKVRRIWPGASRDRHVDVVWLCFMAPHRHLVDVLVTSARTNTNVPHIGARLPLLGSLALGAEHSKLNANLRTSALLGTPSVQSVHDYYPFAQDDGGQ